MREVYEPLHTVFAGTYTEVMRCKRLTDGAPVIVKRLQETTVTAGRIARLRHEYALLVALQRGGARGVPVPVELYEANGVHALVTQDTGGTALDALRAAAPLSARTLLSIATQVARALVGVHAQHVVHKDINPRNVVYNPATDEAQLIDFGLASQARRVPSPLDAGSDSGSDSDNGAESEPAAPANALLEGTLTHMAPEQTGRLATAVGHRADLYGLGALLYDLLTGQPPVAPQDQAKMIYDILTVAPPTPRSLVPAISETLEAIVLKLMDKDPCGRYHSAFGVYRDLSRYAQELAQRGQVAPFTLAQHDRTEELEWRPTLHGRDGAMERLTAALQRPPREHPQVIWLAGASGMGKTALLAELARRAAELPEALVATGLYEPRRAHLGLHGVADALTQLMRSVLMSPKERLEAWRRRVQEALGGIGRMAQELVPTLAGLVGDQPALPEIGREQAENRLVTTLQRLVLALGKANPLVLCLDDLHAADATTLRLLRALAAATPDRHAITLVLSYDPTAVNAEGPLAEWLAEAGATTAPEVIEPLGPETLTAWLAETLQADASTLEPFAAAVHKKTGGVPASVRTFVQALWHARLLRFDAQGGGWTWDLAEILRQRVSGSVVEALKERLQELPADTKTLLATAACIGVDLDLAALQAVAEEPPVTLMRRLGPALEEGILVALQEAGSLRFTHESVRAAAERMIPEPAQHRAHARMASYMLDAAPATPNADWVCNLADHVAVGMKAGTLKMGRNEAAERLVEAAWRVYRSFNYTGSLAYANEAIQVLGPERLANYLVVSQSARFVQVVCLLALNLRDEAERLTQQDVDTAPTTMVLTRALWAHGYLLWLLGRNMDCIATFVEALRLKGERVPLAPNVFDIVWQQVRLTWAMRRRGLSIADLAELPENVEERSGALWPLLRDILMPAVYVRPMLVMWVCLRLTRITAEHGVYLTNAGMYSALMIRASTTGRFRTARAWSNMMRRLSARGREVQDHASLAVRGSMSTDSTYVEFFSVISLDCFVQPPHWVDEQLGRFVAELNDLGDTATGTLASFVHLFFLCSVSLERCMAQAKRQQSTKAIESNPDALLEMRTFVAMCKLFQGTLQVSGAELALVANASTRASKVAPVTRGFNVLVGAMNLMLRNLQAALARLVPGSFEDVSTGVLVRVTNAVVACLTYTQAAFDGHVLSRAQQRDLAANERILREVGGMEGSRYVGPMQLVRAERLALAGKALEASRLYASACEHMARDASPMFHAFGLEFAGRFHMRQKQRQAARAYLTNACRAYEIWGTTHKTSTLEKEFPGLARPTQDRDSSASAGSTTTSLALGHSQEAIAFLRDIGERLAGVFELPVLLDRAMELIVQVAGESRAVLLTRSPEGTLQVQRDSAHTPNELPAALLQGKAPALMRVITRVSTDEQVSQDPHFAAWSSGFCIEAPIVHRTQVLGVIYCENPESLAYSADTAQRLDMVAGQLAVALENASVYNGLEQQVELRTREARELQERLDSVALTDTEVQIASGFAQAIKPNVTTARAALDDAKHLDASGAAALGLGKLEMLAHIERGTLQGSTEGMPGQLDALLAWHTQLQAALGRVNDGIDRALNITGQFLDYAQVASGRAGDHHVPLGALLRRATAALAPDLAAHGIDLQLQVPDDLQLPMREEHAEVIVRNLLANARDALVSRSDAAERRVVLTATALNGRIDFSVSDTGIGMSAASQAQVFRAFFTTKGAQGLGLGLGLSRKLARLYQGDLVFASREGQGSTFTLTVPG